MITNKMTEIPLQAILRPQQPTKYQAEIINTLINVTNSGKAKNTQRCFASALRQLNGNADLKNPEQVKTYIANCKLANISKNKLALAYTWFCKTNGIQWTAPYFKWERKIPLIPTTENITISGQIYVEYGTCRLVESDLQESLSMLQGGLTSASNISKHTELVKHTGR